MSCNAPTVVVIGDRNTGKTTAILQYVLGMCDESKLLPTIEDVYRKPMANKKILEIIDTAGKESTFAVMRDLYKNSAKGFMIFYAVNSISSWQRMMREFTDLKMSKDSADKPIVIVGTYVKEQRKVTKEQLEAFGATNQVRFFEIDLKKKKEISAAFDYIVAQMELHMFKGEEEGGEGGEEKSSLFKRCFCF